MGTLKSDETTHSPRDDIGQRDRLGEAREDQGRGEDHKHNLPSEIGKQVGLITMAVFKVMLKQECPTSLKTEAHLVHIPARAGREDFAVARGEERPD
jgi:hypothetical protein